MAPADERLEEPERGRLKCAGAAVSDEHRDAQIYVGDLGRDLLDLAALLDFEFGGLHVQDRVVVLVGDGHVEFTGHRLGAMPVRRAGTDRARIAAAGADGMLAGGKDLLLHRVAGHDLVLLRQELHREMHAIQFAAWHREVARLLCATRQHDRERGQVVGRPGAA